MPISGMPRWRWSVLMRATAWRMAKAASTDRRAWSGSGTGAPQKAITQSPMYLSMVPRRWRISCVRLLNTRLSKACRSAAVMVSDNWVKPRMSLNITVSSRSSARML